MATVNYDKLVKVANGLCEQSLKSGASLKEAGKGSVGFLAEEFKAKNYKASDFDFGRLFEACFGRGNFLACRDRDELATRVFEAEGAVSTSSFLNISGQIAFSAVMEGFEMEAAVFTALIPTRQTPYNGEKIPGISHIGDEALVVNEGDPFPLVGVVEDWIETTQPQKRGLECDLTREAVFFDRTGILLQRCRAVGEMLGISKENRIIDCVIDEGTGASSARTGHRYRWRNDSIATYGNNSGTHSWDNLQASNGLVDWTDLDAAELLFSQITDPNTAEPVSSDLTHLVCTPQLQATAMYILNATEIEVTTPGFATSGNPNTTRVGNPYRNKYQLLTSRRLATRLTTDTDWFLCNPAKAWEYTENWGIKTIQAPPNSYDEFKRDIVMGIRADERGNPSTREPRYSIKSTA